MNKKSFTYIGENNNNYNSRLRKDIDWKDYLIKYLQLTSEKKSKWERV